MWKDSLNQQDGGFARRGTQDHEQSAIGTPIIWEGREQEDSEYVWWRGEIGTIKCTSIDTKLKVIQQFKKEKDKKVKTHKRVFSRVIAKQYLKDIKTNTLNYV